MLLQDRPRWHFSLQLTPTFLDLRLANLSLSQCATPFLHWSLWVLCEAHDYEGGLAVVGVLGLGTWETEYISPPHKIMEQM